MMVEKIKVGPRGVKNAENEWSDEWEGDGDGDGNDNGWNGWKERIRMGITLYGVPGT